LYWYIKEQFANFRLWIEWRGGRRDDNLSVYVRVPGARVPKALQGADQQGHEIQNNEIGFDLQTKTRSQPEKGTRAIYNLQAPTGFPSNPIGDWNTFLIEANGPQIKVTLNKQLINTYQSTRRISGYIALQCHHYSSRVQFRNLQIQTLP